MDRPSPSRHYAGHRRACYLAFAVGTIAIGLAVHWHGKSISPNVRDVPGDMLWAIMIYWWISAMAPRTRYLARGAAALAVCVAVELSQLYHMPTLDAFCRTRVGHLFLGSGFDPRDLLAYSLGVTIAIICEATVVGVRRNRERASGTR